MRVLCIDFETANYNPESACAIGYALVENGKLIESGSYLIKPHDAYSEFRADFIQIHGIKPSHVKNEPEFPEIYAKISHLFEGSVLAAHFAVFDSKVLRSLMNLYSIDFPEKDFICTCRLTQKLWKGLENHKLPTVCRHVKFKLNHHDAGSDAKGCSAVLQKVVGELKATTVDELSYHSKVKIGVLKKDGMSYRKGKINSKFKTQNSKVRREK
jgi:DNA polymerase-3 subunit epsilon